jgi:16S rRNA A1518/A1519 N6-dimethyltransferase RsmA/KsgA/DIM1 with predicted DNA glycosylase/AP lyase activity
MVIFAAFFLFIFLGLLAIFVLFFVSRRFSPIPYFPSNGKDIEKIISLLALKDNQILYDLGAGDGVVVFAAARASLTHLTRFAAVEINPVLIAFMRLRRRLHPNRKNIAILKKDIFTLSLPPTTYRLQPIFFMYISPWFMEKTIANLLRQFRSIELVTYFYAVPRSKKYKIKLRKHVKNVHDIYKYTLTRAS